MEYNSVLNELIIGWVSYYTLPYQWQTSVMTYQKYLFADNIHQLLEGGIVSLTRDIKLKMNVNRLIPNVLV